MSKASNYIGYGTGKRKSAIARVWISKGSGAININNREYQSYLCRPTLGILARRPLTDLGLGDAYDVKATAKGGGTSGQAGALRLGIARALLNMDENLRSTLRTGGHLTRDARVKERKKYGRKKARRGFQFCKR